jgi:hypothetical protein
MTKLGWRCSIPREHHPSCLEVAFTDDILQSNIVDQANVRAVQALLPSTQDKAAPKVTREFLRGPFTISLSPVAKT